MSGASHNPSGPAHTLDYAPRSNRLAWARRHWRRLLLLTLTLTIGFMLWWKWIPVRHYVLWQYRFRQALAFRMPEKSADIYIDDAAGVVRAASDRDYQVQRSLPSMPGEKPFDFAKFTPRVYRDLFAVDPRLTSASRADSAIAFMGVLHRPDGLPRFVLVAGTGGDTTRILAEIDILVLPLPDWAESPPTIKGRSVGRMYVGPGIPPLAIRFRSGRTDSKDRSHIIFDCELYRGTNYLGPPFTMVGTGLIDAFLQNDDSIVFTLNNTSYADQFTRIGAPVALPGSFFVREVQASLSRPRRIPSTTISPTNAQMR